MAVKPGSIRCAIYTRKSSEEGLEQEFNSLDAQREACEAYVTSQKHEGWMVLLSRYDDGGFSGGTMERPALRQLLADIALGKIDVVVVYKVDRLTRTLTDFARIVEAFDGKGVSFVSVTQQFNTTTSMGRLTLNVLLSFAQFEREVTGERIRDKIAASKKKGMWMGGFVPLGYEVRERKLVVVDEEAAVVRALFQLYEDLGTVALVKAEADRRGYRTKQRSWASGKHTGGIAITRGHLYKLLCNPIYAGRIAHKGEIHDGEHDAIIDAECWDRVQQQLGRQARRQRVRPTARYPSLLAGMIVDADGAPLTPSHANKQGRRYRYYVSRDIVQHGTSQPGWRVPAIEIEGAVKRAIESFLTDAGRLTAELVLTGALENRQAITLAAALVERIDRTLLLDLDLTVTLHPDRLTLSMGTAQLRKALDLPQHGDLDAKVIVDVPMEIRRRGVEMKLVIAADHTDGRMIDPTLVKAIARGRAWFEEIVTGTAPSISEIAQREGVTMRYVSQHIDFAFLSPTIVETILEGRQPVQMTLQSLKQVDLPADWVDQARVLNFR
jgi:site-specific DNA recombinase